MQKRDKGELGYLNNRKQFLLILTIISLVIIALILGMGIVIFGSKNSYMTVAAAVLTLPAAKIAVSYLILLQHKSTTNELYEAVQDKSASCNKYYDCVISSKDKVMGVQAIVVSDTEICAYSIETKIDETYFEAAIGEFLKRDKLSAKVSLYKNEKQYLKKIEHIDAAFDAQSEDCRDKMNWIANSLMIMCL